MVTQANKGSNEREAKKKAKVFKNHFRSGGEENERRMANNVMQGRRVYDGYLVWLDLTKISPATVPEILLATSQALRWFSLEEERVMRQSSVSISLSFENQGNNPVGGSSKVTRTYTNKQEPRNQREKGLSIPSR